MSPGASTARTQGTAASAARAGAEVGGAHGGGRERQGDSVQWERSLHS